MKVAIKASLINYNFFSRRTELGITQKTLSEMSGVDVDFISKVERMELPPGRFKTIKRKLNSLSSALGCDFDYLFPAEYLDAIQKQVLPSRTGRVIWVREISLERLGSTQAVYLDETDEKLTSESLKAMVGKMLGDLPEKQRMVLEARFGIDQEPKTLRGTAELYGTTAERVRQIEANALRKLRYSHIAGTLREFVQ